MTDKFPIFAYWATDLAGRASHYTPEFFSQCGPETLRTLHDSLATDADFYRRHADALTARVGELAAELARREPTTEEPK